MDEAFEILLAAYRKEIADRAENEARLNQVIDGLQQALLKQGRGEPLIPAGVTKKDGR